MKTPPQEWGGAFVLEVLYVAHRPISNQAAFTSAYSIVTKRFWGNAAYVDVEVAPAINTAALAGGNGIHAGDLPWRQFLEQLGDMEQPPIV